MKYEDGLNDLAGGKPFVKAPLEPPIHFNCRFKALELDPHKAYTGEWCIMVMTKDKNKGYSRERYNSEWTAQADIDKLMSGKDTANAAFGGDLDIKNIFLIIPMPAPKT